VSNYREIVAWAPGLSVLRTGQGPILQYIPDEKSLTALPRRETISVAIVVSSFLSLINKSQHLKANIDHERIDRLPVNPPPVLPATET